MSNGFVTLLIGESYLPGILTLGLKLKQLETKHKLLILLDTNSISPESKQLIEDIYDEIIPIAKINAPLEQLKDKLGREELSITYSKLLLWDLDYENLVYLDADVLPLANIDELFKIEVGVDEIAASPDSGWPDIFNSGVIKLKPNKETFSKLIEFSKSHESFDGGDQGLLNDFFPDWIRLKYLFNVTPNYRNDYQFLPAFHRFFNDIKILHFIGNVKPWHYNSILSSDLANFHNYWWNDFNKFFNHDEKLKYKLLNVKGEAINLKFEKVDNVWDKKNEVGEEKGDEDVEVPHIFPWEGKSEATRVFHDYHNEEPEVDKKLNKSIEELKTTKISSPSDKSNLLQRNYGFDNKDNDFDPDKALDEVSKLPFKFFERSKH
ncbi:unnamed protein product [Candida verbasci]|uniref:glycogenin glucosyltransferase n=1 Tax=Candida verbasci TaxID=1227364 RepID=A0A9W4TTS0_9ASCO|nr:unnamed protein product [Candida verbasci]